MTAAEYYAAQDAACRELREAIEAHDLNRHRDLAARILPLAREFFGLGSAPLTEVERVFLGTLGDRARHGGERIMAGLGS